MAHDFKKFPELTNSQMDLYYMDSPHKQITESFFGKIVEVHDGDTARIKTEFRNFDFPIRFANIQAPELNEEGGLESAVWMKDQILGEEVFVVIDPENRVGKFGRIIGDVQFGGQSMSEASLNARQSRVFGTLPEGAIPTLEAIF